MPLPWVRLDSNIGTHDKILALLAERDGAKAFVLYVCALGYSGAHGTDGVIPKQALTINHGTPRLARMLVEHRLWDHNGGGGYVIRNWAERQELTAVTEGKRRAASEASRKANCIRWHGSDCGCWRTPETDPKRNPIGHPRRTPTNVRTDGRTDGDHPTART